MPTEDVSRLLQTSGIGGSALLKCFALRLVQMAMSCSQVRGGFVRRVIGRYPNSSAIAATSRGSIISWWPTDDTRERTVVGEEIHIDGGNARKLMTKVPSEGHGFQKHFG